jgi:hypothetical protein
MSVNNNPYLPKNKTLLNFTWNERFEMQGNISLTGQNMLYRLKYFLMQTRGTDAKVKYSRVRTDPFETVISNCFLGYSIE